MARRRKSEDRSVFLTEEQKHQRIQRGFAEIRRLMLEVADLKAAHIKPVTDAITKQWRTLKADTGTEMADLKPFFQIFCRDRLAEEVDDETDAERIRANLRRVYQALQSGEMVDFLDVLTVTAEEEQPVEEEPAESFEDDVGQAESSFEVASGEVENVNTGEGEAAPEQIAAPDADWGDECDLDPADGEDGSDAGFAYHAGEEAAQNGTSFRTLLKRFGKHHASAWATNARAGFDAASRRMAREEAETDDDNVVSMPVPLPKISDGVALTSGDDA